MTENTWQWLPTWPCGMVIMSQNPSRVHCNCLHLNIIAVLQQMTRKGLEGPRVGTASLLAAARRKVQLLLKAKDRCDANPRSRREQRAKGRLVIFWIHWHGDSVDLRGPISVFSRLLDGISKAETGRSRTTHCLTSQEIQLMPPGVWSCGKRGNVGPHSLEFGLRATDTGLNLCSWHIRSFVVHLSFNKHSTSDYFTSLFHSVPVRQMGLHFDT